MAEPAPIIDATGETDPTSKEMLGALFGEPKVIEEKSRAANGKFVAADQVSDVEEKKDEIEEGFGEPGIDDLTDEDTEVVETSSSELSDDTEFEVHVDGKPVKVTFQELKDNYSGEKTVAVRIQKATEARQASEARAEELYNIGKVQLERLKALDNVLKTVATPPQVDWEKLKAEDPLKYAIKREEYRDWQEKQAQVQGEIQRVNAEQAKLAAQARERYLEEQASQLVAKLPVFADPDKGAAFMEQLVQVAMTYGYSRAEAASVLDHRAFLVLSEAAKWRALVARKAAVGKKITTPVSNIKTMKVVGNKSAAPVQAKSKQDAILNQARKSGNVEDVAMTLLVPAKQQARR